MNATRVVTPSPSTPILKRDIADMSAVISKSHFKEYQGHETQQSSDDCGEAQARRTYPYLTHITL